MNYMGHGALGNPKVCHGSSLDGGFGLSGMYSRDWCHRHNGWLWSGEVPVFALNCNYQHRTCDLVTTV